MQTLMQSCDVFKHNTQNSLLLLIHVQVQYDLAITRNTCVNVYSLNYLDLFLKYKIGQTCFVCVCVCVCVCFGSKCLTLFLLRDDFESLTCCLVLWLGSMLDCIQVSVFLFFEKLFLPISTTSRQLSTNCYLSRLFNCFFGILNSYFDPSRNFLDARQLPQSIEILLWTPLDTSSIDRDTLACISFFFCFASSSFFFLCVNSILFFFFLQVYGSLFSSFPLCQHSVCLLSSLLAFYAL